MVIQHNMAAENSARMQKIVSGKLSGVTEKLSSGYRINRGADDAAGLAISEKMRFQIRGLNRGSANIEDGVSYCQVADGALGEMHDMLHRMNELCIQAANGTLSADDRQYIDNEIQALKSETQRICDTTRFNEEYIFRCEDTVAGNTSGNYALTITGRPKDLFIYTDELDKDSYAGVSFRGRRYTWDEISPDMYDPVTKTFNRGRYYIQSVEDGTTLILDCQEDGSALPQVSRMFSTAADVQGVYVNNDLVKWDDMRQMGDTYSFDYHGMTVSFTKDEGDGFDDMLEKISGTVWESKYDCLVEGLSLDAKFTTKQYTFNKVGEANERIGVHVTQNRATKYVIHAVDGNKGGTIPVWDKNGNYVGDAPFDGIWIEGTNADWTTNNKPLMAMPWGSWKLDEMEALEQQGLISPGICAAIKDHIGGRIPGEKWEGTGFGFGCESFTQLNADPTRPNYCDWGNHSTDIWVGTNPHKSPTKDPVNYPADGWPAGVTGNFPASRDYYSGYDPYAPFHFVNANDNNELVDFIFSVINETSKDQAVETLDGINVFYPKIESKDSASPVGSMTGGNVTSGRVSLDKLSLKDEYFLGRDYENGQEKVVLKNNGGVNTGGNENYGQLVYNNNRFSISYGYDRQSGSMTLSGSPVIAQGGTANGLSSNIISSISIPGRTANPASPGANSGTISISSGSISSSYKSQTITMTLRGGQPFDGVTSELDFNYTYNISGFFTGGVNLQYTENANGTYIINSAGVFERFNVNNYDPSDPTTWPPRYNITGMTNANGETLDAYFNRVVYPDIANRTRVQLKTEDFPKGTLSATEDPQIVNVTRYQTPFQHEPAKAVKQPTEKPEYLKIQCSSNTIDHISIQKQKLSLKRLGLANVGCLSEIQATGCIDTVGKALAKVNSVRSLFGAYQNRLEHAYAINRNTHENTQSAESVIRDTDMADTMVQFSNQNILQQSSNAMLAQANQVNQGVLTLLQ